MKSGNVNQEDLRPRAVFYEALIKEAEQSGIHLDVEQIQAMKIPNTPESLRAFGWMDWYFNLVGDKQPNSVQIQLETQTIQGVYEEFVEHENASKSPQAKNVMCMQTFFKLWKLVFPHVRIREYKDVCGKQYDKLSH